MSKRGAKPIPAAQPVGPALDGELLEARNQQIAAMHEHQREVIEQFGDGLPWSPEHYEAEIRLDLGRSAESFLRAGRKLLVARACASHGEWGAMLRRLNLGDDTALHMMAWARQIGGVSNPERVRDLTGAATTIGRMIELAKLPPEQFQELAEHGKTGELALDDVAVMSRDELRAAVREARADLQTKDDVAAQTDERVRKLEEDLAKARREARKATPDDVLSKLRSRIDAVALGVEAEINATGDVGSLRRWVGELTEHAASHDLDVLPYLAGVFAQLERALHVLRGEFGIPRAAVGDPAEEARLTLGQGA